MRFRPVRAAAALALLALGTAQGARPVARWDVVPDQCFDGVFNAGVCAFHIDGVTVEFSVGGTLVHTATNPTLNPRTGVWEYWVPLRASDYPDGPISVAARAIPSGTAHPEAYDLPPLTLHANAGGSLTVATTHWADAERGADTNPGTEQAPFQTLAAAMRKTPPGGTVNLRPGTYSADRLGGGSARPYWTLIQAAPGVERDAVRIGPGRPGTQRLLFRHVTLFCEADQGRYATILMGENGRHAVWLDDCKTHNTKGRWAANSTPFGNRYTAYVTGGVTTDMGNGPGGSLLRDHVIETLASDAFTGSGRLVVNCSCRGIDPGPTGAHPDFHQSHAVAPDWCEDVILYNVRGTDCVSQGLFGTRLRNSAFVNVAFEKGRTVMCSQYSGPMENVLFLHLSIVNQSWLWRKGYAPTDVRVANSLFPSMDGCAGDGSAGLWVDHGHFADPGRTCGTEATTGNPQFTDPAAKDFHLAAGSPAQGNGRFLQCVPADLEGRPHPAEGRNRGAYADKPPEPAPLP